MLECILFSCVRKIEFMGNRNRAQLQKVTPLSGLGRTLASACQPASQPRQSTSHQPNSRPVVPAPFLCSFLCVRLFNDLSSVAAGISCLLDNASLSFQFKAIESIFCIIQTQTESIRRQTTIWLLYACWKLPPYIEKGGVVAEGVERQKANVRIPAQLTCCNTL